MKIAAGQPIGRYLLEERIAGGGMGEVWRARDMAGGRTVAIKLLREDHLDDDGFIRRFRNEAEHTAALSHPGIARVIDIGDVDGRAYLVMDYITGEPLSAVLARETRLPVEQTLDIVGQAAMALQAAHDAGVVHRDIKPGNLLIRPDGVVKVTDFGVARAVDKASTTQTGMVVGTAAYLSPEQADGRPVSPATDVYALGLVAYECLTGSRPFAGSTAAELAGAHLSTAPPPLPADVPAVVADFVLRALAKDPARRQASAADFGRIALALAASLSGDEPTRAGVPPAPRAAAPVATFDDSERRRVRNVFIGVGALVVALGFLALHSCGGGHGW